MTVKLAIVGNANVGKSTLFNLLTNSQAQVGNWAGVTSEPKKGQLKTDSAVQVFDTPGVFSITEMLAHFSIYGWIKDSQITHVIQVVHEQHLKRDLCMTQQLQLLGLPVCLVFRGTQDRFLTFARCLIDFNVLLKRFEDSLDLNEFLRQKPASSANFDVLEQELAYYQKLAFSDPNFLMILEKRYELAQAIAVRIPKTVVSAKKPRASILLFLVFFAVMCFIFSLSIGVGGALSAMMHYPLDLVFVKMNAWILPPMMAIIIEGASIGIGLLFDFFFPLLILYLLLRWMEESGYSARIAVAMDGFFRKMGLSGKVFLPMLMSLGCNVPAIASTRMLPSAEKIKAALMLPFMTCSARLATYVAITAVYCPESGVWAVMALYLLGFAVAVLTALVAKKMKVAAASTPLVMTIPPLDFTFRGRYIKEAYSQALIFVRQAALVVVGGSVVVHAFVHYSPTFLDQLAPVFLFLFSPFDYTVNQLPAVLGIISGFLAKEMVVATMGAYHSASIDLVIPLSIFDFLVQMLNAAFTHLYDFFFLWTSPELALNQMSTQKAHLIGIFETKAQALSFLVFVGLYFPCVSTIAVLKSIVGSYKAYGIVVWSVFVAYLIAWIFYDLMHHFEHVLYAGVFFLGYILFNFIKHKRLLMRSI